MLLTSAMSAVLTTRHLNDRGRGEGGFYAIPNPPSANSTTTNSHSSNIFATSQQQEAVPKANNIFAAAKTTTDRSTDDTTTPTLTFTVRIGMPNNLSAPTETDRLALLCQFNRFVQHRLRDQTGDAAIVTNLQNLNWKSTYEVQFTVHAIFGYGKPISPWTLVKVMELPKDDIRMLVKRYVWPLPPFAQTRTLFFGGKLGYHSGNKPPLEELPLESCPPAPPTPAPTLAPAPTFKPFGFIGFQTVVPREENNQRSNGPLFLAPLAEEEEEVKDDHSQSSPASFLDRRNRLTISVPFWIANHQGITDASTIQTQWLDPTFPMLVDRVVDNLHYDSNNPPRVVPNSSHIVHVQLMPCPLPTQDIGIPWICHRAMGSYELQAANLTIPLWEDPSLYTHAIRNAMDSGLFYQSMLRRHPEDAATIRIGSDVEALQYSWWQQQQSNRHKTNNPHQSTSTTTKTTTTTTTMAGVIALVCLAVAFFLLLLTSIVLKVYYRHKIRVLKQHRETALCEMNALLLTEEPPIPGEGCWGETTASTVWNFKERPTCCLSSFLKRA